MLKIQFSWVKLMETSARLFNCSLCKKQVIICSYCDKGNIYCGYRCSQHVRAQNHRIANKKYQKTSQGRQKHIERQRRYRKRLANKNKVTDQGCHNLLHHDLLSEVSSKKEARQGEPIFCDFCDEIVSSFFRYGYLHQHRNEKWRFPLSWPLVF